MAEVDTGMLHQDHADIRREAAQYSADERYDIATRAGDIRREVASAACDLGKQIGSGFGDTRYNIAERTGDIRREQAVGFGNVRHDIADRAGDIRREVATGFDKTGDLLMTEGQEGIMATKDARLDVSNRITNATDRVSDRVMELRGLVGERFYTVGRDLADLRQGQATLSKDVELNALKGQLDAAKNTTYLSDRIAMDGDKTRALINDLKYHDLNRGLVERNTELVNCEQDRRLYRDRWDDARFNQLQLGFQGQWAQLQSQIQAFQSQLQETRQGLVNFGTMDRGAGTQSSTSNNVR
jgi:hypothetical protein